MKKCRIALLVCILMLPVALGTSQDAGSRWPGLSWEPVTPLPRVFFVGSTGVEGNLNYLSAIPACVFSHDDVIYSNPLLFYETTSPHVELDEHQGIAYFMDDWVDYCDGLGEITIINADDNEIRSEWPADTYTVIRGNPYEVAAQVALHEWPQVEEVVVAVIDDKEQIQIHEGIAQGELPPSEIKKFKIQGSKTPTITPTYHNFTIPDGYKYITAHMEWGGSKGKDPDLQLWDYQLGMVGASELWNIAHGAYEHIDSYVYNPGEWGLTVTYMPTVGSSSAMLKADYEIDVTLYPGVDCALEPTPFGCRNATFMLQCPRQTELIIRGPSGAVLDSSSGRRAHTLHMAKFGTGAYAATVIGTDSSAVEVPFTLSYRWEGRSPLPARAIASASEGAILASVKNIPLLYAQPDHVPPTTQDAIRELGAKKVWLLDLAHNGSVKEELEGIGMDVATITNEQEAYSTIRRLTDQKGIVFSTLSHAGPGAYAAAHHGAPLLLIELDPSLSCSAAWCEANWLQNQRTRELPPVGGMLLSGRQVYGCLEGYGMDDSGLEHVLTIAGPELGPVWDRSLLGAAITGRLVGSPTHVAYWFCRNAFYPALIYSNPGLSDVQMGNGTSSRGRAPLVMVEGGGDVTVRYPVTHTWVCYTHRFNEVGSEYWGLNYTTVQGITPYWDRSNARIDATDRGGYWPDISPTEVVPHYLEHGGYESVWATNFDDIVRNLNAGSLLWLGNMHGAQVDGGILNFWHSTFERNPWRAYETGGCTAQPDTRAMSKRTGLDLVRGHDGVIIAVLEQQIHTRPVNGYRFDKALGNLHSTGIFLGACKIADTFMHQSLVRHGSAFQILDPWETSWYANYAIEIWVRQIALGDTVGEAYEKAIRQVGVEPLTDGGGWWDVMENIVYYGDPDLRVFVPERGWERPALWDEVEGKSIGEHVPFSP